MSHGAAAPRIQLWAAWASGGTGREGGLTSLPVTEFTAPHGKIATKLSSPPLLQADAEFWHPPGWQDRPGGSASSGGRGAVPTHSRTAAPRGCRCKHPHLPDARGDGLHYLELHPFLSSQR